MFGRRKRTVPQLNATSTADISFMLLIFFLVTTSMDMDKGLARRMPPPEKPQQEESNVNRNTLMRIEITADNNMLANGIVCTQKELQTEIENFILKQGRNHLIQIDANPYASYNVYFKTQNAITAAYNSLRNRLTMKLYNRHYTLCSQEEREEINRRCPQRVSENYDITEKGGESNANKTE